MLRRLTLIITLLVGLTFSAVAFPRAYYAEHSRLSNGTWVKIKTPVTGIYQFTYQELRLMGFANPTKVQVYGYQATCDLLTNTFSTDQPDDLKALATRHVDGKLLFYGVGDCDVYATSLSKSYNNVVRTRTPYDTGSYYFLSDTETPSEVPQRSRVTPMSEQSLRVFDSHITVVYREEELQNVAKGGVIFHGKNIVPGSTVSYTFELPGYAPFNRIEGFTASAGQEVVFHNRMGFRSATTQMPRAEYACDDNFTIAGINDNGCYPTAALISFRNANQVAQLKLADPDAPEYPDKVTVSITQPQSNQEYLAEDYQAVVYSRYNELTPESPFLLMTAPSTCNPRHQMFFPGVTASEIEVWNVTNAYQIDKYPLSSTSKYAPAGGTLLTMDANTQRLVAFRLDGSYPTPEVIGKIENQDLHATPTPDMVIIATAPLLPYAEELADLHREYQGMDVVVVDHNQLYNEFSSGARSPMAYRRFLKMLRDRDQRLEYLLFLGQANYDNRGILTGRDVTDELVLWSQDDESDAANLCLNYALDARMGMLQDNYETRYTHPLQPVQLAVGRLPFGPGDASAYVAKARRWFSNPVPPEVYNNVVVMGGSGDNQTHVGHAEEIIDTLRIVNPNLTVRPLHFEMYSKNISSQLAANLKEGVGYLEYSGHGNPIQIEHWGLSEAKNFEYTYPVIAMISSCDQFALDHSEVGLVTTMLAQPNGGAIAAIAASRGVYINQNQRSAVPFSVGYAKARAGQTVGQIYRDQRNDYIASQKDLPSVGFKNISSFNLGGDPAMPVYAPSHSMALSTVDGRAVGSDTRVEAYKPVKITGYVADASGKRDNGFSGTMTLTVFDSPRTSVTYNTASVNPYNPVTVKDPTQVLAKVPAKVENGAFELEITLPSPTHDVSDYRMVFTAFDPDGSRAVGSFDRLSITPVQPGQGGSAVAGSPSIVSLDIEVDRSSVNNPVGATATVKAVVEPSSAGLDMRTSAVNSTSRLAIDGVLQHASIAPYMHMNEDGMMAFEIPVSGLSNGVHSAELFVVSNSGLATTMSQEFTVLRQPLAPEIVIEEGNISEPIDINLDTPCDYVQLEINDTAGKHVFKADKVTLPFRWNLCGTDGKPVEDGRYDIVARVSSGNNYGSAKRQIIIYR